MCFFTLEGTFQWWKWSKTMINYQIWEICGYQMFTYFQTNPSRCIVFAFLWRPSDPSTRLHGRLQAHPTQKKNWRKRAKLAMANRLHVGNLPWKHNVVALLGFTEEYQTKTKTFPKLGCSQESETWFVYQIDGFRRTSNSVKFGKKWHFFPHPITAGLIHPRQLKAIACIKQHHADGHCHKKLNTTMRMPHDATLNGGHWLPMFLYWFVWNIGYTKTSALLTHHGSDPNGHTLGRTPFSHCVYHQMGSFLANHKIQYAGLSEKYPYIHRLITIVSIEVA